MTTPRPPRPTRFLALASALTVGALLAAAACSDGDGGDSTAASDASASPAASGASATSVARHTATPTAPGRLTKAGARAALVTEADLEDDWTQVQDAADWQDSLLIGEVDAAAFLTGKTDVTDCQRLLDSLHGEDLLGEPSGASALTGFREGDSRLLYQVAAYDRSGLDDSLAWLKSLPDTCDEFTVTGTGGKRTVQVVQASLPKAGDARQGLTMTVRGAADGDPVTLTLDVAAVRVGTNAITVTNGGLDGADHDSTKQAVKLGAQRLQDVLAGRTPTAQPSNID